MRHEQTKIFKLLWLLPFAIIVFLFGCDLFLASEKPRDNPLDPENPTPGVNELKAFGYSANSIQLQWKTDPDGDGNYPSVMIVRNSAQEPTSTNDGTLVYSGPTTIAEGDEYAEFTDDEVAEETDYYYGIWAYTEQEGTITYNGPVTDTATTKVHFAEMPPVQDGSLNCYNYPPLEYYFSTDRFDFPIYNDPGFEEYYYFIWFDFLNAPDFGELAEADLVLYHYSSPMGTTMDLSARQIIEPWDPEAARATMADAQALYNQVTANSFTTFSDQASGSTIQIAGENYGEYVWPVSDIVTNWLTKGDPNYGIILRSPAANLNWYYFNGSTADMQFQPRLRLQYYGDPPLYD